MIFFTLHLVSVSMFVGLWMRTAIFAAVFVNFFRLRNTAKRFVANIRKAKLCDGKNRVSRLIVRFNETDLLANRILRVVLFAYMLLQFRLSRMCLFCDESLLIYTKLPGLNVDVYTKHRQTQQAKNEVLRFFRQNFLFFSLIDVALLFAVLYCIGIANQISKNRKCNHDPMQDVVEMVFYVLAATRLCEIFDRNTQRKIRMVDRFFAKKNSVSKI